MAKGKYEKWLEPDSLILLEAWARDGLTDEQIASNMGEARKLLILLLKTHYIKKDSDLLKLSKNLSR